MHWKFLRFHDSADEKGMSVKVLLGCFVKWKATKYNGFTGHFFPLIKGSKLSRKYPLLWLPGAGDQR